MNSHVQKFKRKNQEYKVLEKGGEKKKKNRENQVCEVCKTKQQMKYEDALERKTAICLLYCTVN